MIEGLRILPWLQERIRNDKQTVATLIDCERCMATNTKLIRQHMGCGYETRSEFSRPWVHQGYSDEMPTTCPGYTTKLPEVIEINRARLHWKQGELRDHCGDVPTENIYRGIEILEGAANEASCWRPEDKK